MGVKNLLPTLQSITRSVGLEKYRGLTAAVDAMSWLHKGVFSTDVKALATSQRGGLESEKATAAELKCINYAIKKAELLRDQFGISVILVIDGDALPSKKEENAKRREERDKAFEKAVAAEKARDSRAARRFYAQSCSVTHKIRYELIKACQQLNIAFIVAPYEADAQMARLAHTGMVDLVITEDSDILVYGCPRALFKVDFDTSRGQEIQLMRDLAKNDALSFRNWTHDMFVFMCIISGCDYCKGVPGIGIKLAHKLVRVHRTPSKIFGALRAAGRMPPDFEETFWIAFRTFRHQRVFCPSKQQIETLWPIAGSNHEAWSFLGEEIEPGIASKIADGTLHPSKKVPWREALQEGEASRNAPPGHRRSNANAVEGRTQRGAPTDNVWHALFYGPKADGRHSPPKPARKENERNHSTRDNRGPPRQDVFSFFPKSNEQGRGDALEKSSSDGSRARPPLQEIYVEDEAADSSSQPKPAYVPPPYHRDVPIHFHEYASRLVSKAFKPISRKRRTQQNAGTQSSKYVEKIWQRSKGPARESRAATVGEGKEMQANGVGRFKRDKTEPDSFQRPHEEQSSHSFHPAFGSTAAPPSFAFNQGMDCHYQSEDNYHLDYTRPLQPFDDGSIVSSHQPAGREGWYPEVFRSSASQVSAPAHAHSSSSNSQLYHQPFASEASSVDERHLFGEVQSISGPGLYCCDDDTHSRYSGQFNYDDFHEEARDVFQQLQTTVKQKPFATAPRDCYDHADAAAGHAHEADSYGNIKMMDWDEHGIGDDVGVFQQIQTTVKPKSNDDAPRSYMDASDSQMHCSYGDGSATYGGHSSDAMMLDDGLSNPFQAFQ
ncbi:hypothetical protein ACHAXT_003517 [Thalassiosira profunda]